MPTFENQKSVHYVREAHIMGAKRTSRARSPFSRGPGPALGPWKLWVSRCSLVQSEPILGTISPKIQPKFMGNFCVIPNKKVIEVNSTF